MKRIIAILTLVFAVSILNAQDNRAIDSIRYIGNIANLQDVPEQAAPLSRYDQKMLARSAEFGKHSPTRATIYAMVCPGLGQIYNKQYWKLPILYGGVALAIYGVSWNNRTYQKYRDAYYDLSMYIDSLSVNTEYPYPDDPAWEKIPLRGADWKTLFESRPSSMTRYQAIMYNKRRSFKRNRDLCYIALAGVYLLNVLDACVFAHFYDFYINDDISLHWQPRTSFNKRTGKSNYGATVSLTF